MTPDARGCGDWSGDKVSVAGIDGGAARCPAAWQALRPAIEAATSVVSSDVILVLPGLAPLAGVRLDGVRVGRDVGGMIVATDVAVQTICPATPVVELERQRERALSSGLISCVWWAVR